MTKESTEAAKLLGKIGGLKGGKTTSQKYGKHFFSIIGKKGMANRWSKKPTSL